MIQKIKDYYLTLVSIFVNVLYRNNSKNIEDNTIKTEKIEKSVSKFSEILEILEKTRISKVKFNIAPHIFYIKNNVEKLLFTCLDELKKQNFFPKIGIEIEFYSLEKIENISKFFCVIYDFANKNNIEIQNIEKERGCNQFEIQFKPYNNVKLLIKHYEILKYFLLNLENYKLTFEARPFYYDVGSALQVNLSLLNDKNENLFAKIKKNGEEIESNVLKKCIAGILEKTNTFLPLYTISKNCLTRYDLDFCKIFYSLGKMPSPVFNCWGINNRTCSIRIPTPKNFNDFENYKIESKKNRRIEFRVPSSNSEIKLVLYGILNSILYGLTNNLEPPLPTSNNVLKDNTEYKAILD